jgi:CubicO group peptidase (beta-lactamase class C family)
MKWIVLQLTFFFWSCTAVAQLKDIVATDGFINALHQANTGRIVFMTKKIAAEKILATDFLQRFQLQPASNLNFRVFMSNSITNYLHALAPDVAPEELIKKGNYQFSFLVDGKLIYVENLHPGAGLNKHTTTTFRMPLTSTYGEDLWSLYMWNRFMANGGELALQEGRHQFALEMRPYLKTDTTQVGELIARGDIQLIVTKPVATAAQKAVQPLQPGSGFAISKAGFNANQIRALNAAIAEYKFKEITGLVVLKDGKLLLEEYFNQCNRQTLHDTRSVTKTVTAAVLDIAINTGYISNEQLQLSSFYPLHNFANYSTKKDSVRLLDLLTMSSAFDGSDERDDSPGNEENMYPTNNWVKFALDLPMDSLKHNGAQWDYFTAGVVLLGDIVNSAVPGGLEKFADAKLFKPLNIKKYQWSFTPQHVPNTAGGLALTALDLAKFGQLYLNKGRWKGQSVLRAAWVASSLQKIQPVPGRTNEFYGYLCWNKTFTVSDKNYETYYCAGNGGSKIYIFPETNMVVVITARAYNRPYAHPQVDQMMTGYILPAIINR